MQILGRKIKINQFIRLIENEILSQYIAIVFKFYI